MASILTVLGLLLTTALINASVLSKLDPGLRYQYVASDEGAELVDLWVKTSDLAQSDAYNPDVHNGYHLFTRNNPSTSQSLAVGQAGVLSNSYYDSKKRTILLVHGWRNVPSSQFHRVLIPAFLEADDVNVIMTDWSVGAAGEYTTAFLNSVRSAESITKCVQWLTEASGGDLSRFHLVGHSLGAHMVGIIGRNLGGVVPYITALDPAGPGWVTNPHRFRPTDGLYTEVLHTNAGVSGHLAPLGDVDFYPNGGINMPGCESDRSCNHHRGTYYFAESLSGGVFLGNQCESLVTALLGTCQGATLNMGGLTPKPGYTGVYHVETNAVPPFSKQ